MLQGKRGKWRPVGVLVALTIALVLGWQAVVLNVGDFFARGEKPEDAAAALTWNARQPEALFVQAVSTVETDPAAARRGLEEAIRANPTDGRAYAVLGSLYENQGNLPAAERAMTTASAMAPERSDVQAQVAMYWMRRGDLAKALEHWDVVLTFEPTLRAKLFPMLLSLAEVPDNQQAFAPLLKKEVPWWPAFFGHVAANATRLDTVRALFNLESKGPNDASPEALKAYLDRLQREGYWTEAYFVWLNSLPGDQLKTVGNLNNGSFEDPISSMGYDWISKPAGSILVETAATYGTTGSRALHVLFRGPRVRFQHLGQYLMLPAGSYTFRGRGRPDDLETAQGVRWSVYCLGSEAPLGTSELFTGRDQWRHFAFPFTVPRSDCPVQVARLELAGRVALDFEAHGDAWFDDLSIERQNLD